MLQKPVRPTTLLQAVEEALIGAGKSAPPAPHPPTSKASTGFDLEFPFKILVVDDSRVNQLVARRMLESCGYQLDIATNGLEAFKVVQSKDYGIVLMDVQMPETNGFEATQKIRSNIPAARQPWIVALTANALDGDRENCLQNGMNDYLPKPFRFPDLERVLKTAKKIPTEKQG